MKAKRSDKQSFGHFDYESVIMGLNAGMADYKRMFVTDVRLARLAESFPVFRGSVLDIGSGGGTITNALAYRYPNAKIFGCDVSASAIELAKKHAGKRTSFGVIKNGKFPYSKNMFDLCICFDVLEHVPDIDTFMQETSRVLKPGGIAFFAVPCEGQPLSITWLLQKLHFGDKLTYKHVGHIHPEFTHEYVVQIFRKYGFRITGISYSEHVLTQCIRFLRFIIPKEIMEFFMGGKKAERYYDRAIIRGKASEQHGFFYAVRRWWISIGSFFDAIERFDAAVNKHNGIGAWKMLLKAEKK